MSPWKTVALVTAATTAIAWSLAAVQRPQYRASAIAAITPRPEGLQPNELMRGVEVLERRTVVASLTALASTPAIGSAVGSGGTTILAVVLPNTNLIRIDAESDDAARATAIANKVPAALSRYAASMFTYYRVTMVTPATRPEAPFLPRTGRAISAGLLAGLFFGGVAAYLLRHRGDPLATRSPVRRGKAKS